MHYRQLWPAEGLQSNFNGKKVGCSRESCYSPNRDRRAKERERYLEEKKVSRCSFDWLASLATIGRTKGVFGDYCNGLLVAFNLIEFLTLLARWTDRIRPRLLNSLRFAANTASTRGSVCSTAATIWTFGQPEQTDKRVEPCWPAIEPGERPLVSFRR